MRIFRNKTNERHLEKLINIQLQTEYYSQLTINNDLSHIKRTLNYANQNTYKEGDLFKASMNYIDEKLDFVIQQQKDLEKLRADILSNYNKLVSILK